MPSLVHPTFEIVLGSFAAVGVVRTVLFQALQVIFHKSFALSFRGSTKSENRTSSVCYLRDQGGSFPCQGASVEGSFDWDSCEFECTRKSLMIVGVVPIGMASRWRAWNCLSHVDSYVSDSQRELEAGSLLCYTRVNHTLSWSQFLDAVSSKALRLPPHLEAKVQEGMVMILHIYIYLITRFHNNLLSHFLLMAQQKVIKAI